MIRRSQGAFKLLFTTASLCAICLIFLFSSGAKPAQALGSGAISLANSGVTVSENFDSLSSTSGVTTATNLPTGWYLSETGAGTDARRNDAYAVGTGSSTSGDVYSFGITGTNPLSDRAFGTLRSGSLIPIIGAKFTNDTGGPITSVTITYTGEMWRAGVGGRNAADTLAFQYSTDAISLTSGTWISYTNLDFSSPVISTTVGAKDGNSAQFRTVQSSTITGLNLPPGSFLWIRWVDLDIPSNDDGLAIDDFFLTPIGTEQAPTVLSTFPISNAINVLLTSNIVITFTEPVTVTGTWFNIVGSSSGTHTATVSGGPTLFTLDPLTDFSLGETVTVTVYAAQVNDWDSNPPPNMLSDYIWTFSTIPAPAVSSTSPISNAINVATTANIIVTFNEPVNVSGTWYTIGCGSSGPHTASPSGGATTWTLNPSPNFANFELCTVTIVASQVTDQVSIPPVHMASDYVWTFTTAPTPYRIHNIQGLSHLSPISGSVVSVSDAIVTAKFPTSGFFVQEKDINADANDYTSEGIFVRTSSPPTVSIGDSVNVVGMVAEYRSGSSNLSRTEIDTTIGSGMIQVNSSGNALPLPIIVGALGRVPPTTIIEDDNPFQNIEFGNTFDPNSDGLDFFESLESMLVQINNAVAVGPTKNAEVVVLADNGGNGAGNRTARGGIIIRSTDNNPERLILASSAIVGSVPNVNVGATFVPTQPITAVVDYDFDNYKLQVTAKPITATNGVTQESTIAPSANQLAVATFNVQNLSPSDSQSKYNSLANLIVSNLKSPDLLIVEEVEDNSGATDDGIVDADITIGKLIDAIANTVGGPTYQYRQINPVDNQDGGVVGGNIRIVFLIRTDRGLMFVDRPGGTSTNATGVTGSGASTQLTFSPGRIDPGNAAWSTPDGSRKPIVGEFIFQGQRLFVIGNHWKSKGGDDPLFGRYQPPTQYTQVQQRNAQAVVVKNFVDSILTLDPNAKIIAAGDFNDFEFASPLTTLKGSVMHALVETLPANERYSYVFEGNSQTLDHILISNSLYNNAFPKFDVVHVNSEFHAQVSDHDPSIVRLGLGRIFFPLIMR